MRELGDKGGRGVLPKPLISSLPIWQRHFHPGVLIRAKRCRVWIMWLPLPCRPSLLLISCQPRRDAANMDLPSSTGFLARNPMASHGSFRAASERWLEGVHTYSEHRACTDAFSCLLEQPRSRILKRLETHHIRTCDPSTAPLLLLVLISPSAPPPWQTRADCFPLTLSCPLPPALPPTCIHLAQL